MGRDDQLDQIQGGEGDDIYEGKGGSDDWFDSSTTSNDYYLVPSSEFSQLFGDAALFIEDGGGSLDVRDLSAYKFTDFAFSRSNSDLIIDGSGKRDIDIGLFFTTNSIDFLKFSDVTFAADQLKPDQR